VIHSTKLGGELNVEGGSRFMKMMASILNVVVLQPSKITLYPANHQKASEFSKPPKFPTQRTNEQQRATKEDGHKHTSITIKADPSTTIQSNIDLPHTSNRKQEQQQRRRQQQESNIKLEMPASKASNNNVNYVEIMYKTLRKQETQLKQKLNSNLKAQTFLRNIMNMERRLANEARSSSMLSRGDIFSQKRATMYPYTTATVSPSLLAFIQNNNNQHQMDCFKKQATDTAAPSSPTMVHGGYSVHRYHHHSLSNNTNTHVQSNNTSTAANNATSNTTTTTNSNIASEKRSDKMNVTSETTTMNNTIRRNRAHSQDFPMAATSIRGSVIDSCDSTVNYSSNVTFPVKYDHFDVTITKPLATDATTGHMSLTMNVKNKSSTNVRFCVTFTNAHGKSICVWPIVSETFKDLCDFELLEGKKDVDIYLDTRQIPEEYLEFEGDRPLTLSIILTSHTAMASTISEVVHLQRQYHSLLRQRQQQRSDRYNNNNRDMMSGNKKKDDDNEDHQCNSCGRTAIIRKSLKIL
jgi:hypothetical protein